MKIGNFDSTGLCIVNRTRTFGNGKNTVCIKPTGFYLGSMAFKSLDLKINKYVLFLKDNEDVNRTERIYFIPHNDDTLISKSSKVTSSGNFLSCMDIISSHPKLLKLSKTKERITRQLTLEWDNEKKGHYIPLKPNLELECIDARRLPESKGVYSLVAQDGEITYIGQGNIKNRVLSHKSANINFQKICYSFVDDKEDRDLWESYLIDQFKKEKGRLPYHNKQNGNNYAKLISVNNFDHNLT